MAKDPDPTLALTTLRGTTRSLDDWTTTFHLLLVALPGRTEATGYAALGERVLHVFQGADCRTAFLVTGADHAARRVLGAVADRFLVFLDPERQAVQSLGLTRLPALVHLRQDTTLAGAAEGWDPAAWNSLVISLAEEMAWSRPTLPAAGDPRPFAGWTA